MTRRQRQRGFTLVELMVAATTGLILMAALGGILSDTLRTADALTSQMAVNRHAREIFDLLSFGSYHNNLDTTASGGVLDFDYVFGFRGRRGVTSGTDVWDIPSDLMVKDADGTTRRYRFALPHNNSAPNGPPAEVILAEGIPDTAVLCTGTDQPLRGCASGATFTGVRGFLRAEPQVRVPGALNGVTEVAFQLIDPQRLNSPRLYQTNMTHTYWTAFTALQQRKPY